MAFFVPLAVAGGAMAAAGTGAAIKGALSGAKPGDAYNVNAGAFQMDPNNPWAQRQAPGMDASLYDRQYGNQQALVQMLQQQAAGQGPSVAQLMMQQGLGQAQAQQMGAAASSSAANRALSMRGAAYNNAAMQQGVIGQMGALRAQEMLQGREALGGMLSGMREQDIGVAGQNLGAQMGQAQLNDQMAQSQLEAAIKEQELRQQAYQQQQELAAQAADARANRWTSLGTALIGGGAGLLGSALGGKK